MISDDKDKKDKIVDFFEYVWNMGIGVLMEFICLKIVFNLVFLYLDFFILWKNF